MDNKCPKCGAKLPWYSLKPECPKCGCNIMYYNMEVRLAADADKAEAEWEKVDRLLWKLTPKRFRKNRDAQPQTEDTGETENENDT